jgi:putative ABC transport system permease protein
MLYLVLRESVISLYSNKLRSFLTILGCVIGVCAVVLMVATGQAVQLEINKQLSGFGGNMLIVMPAVQSKNGIVGARGGRPTLTMGDWEAIKKVKNVTSAMPIVRSNFQVVFGSNNWPTSVMGTSPDVLSVNDLEIEKGVMFSERDVYTGVSHAVIGKTIVDKLFADKEPIGSDIRIKGIPFKVIGVLKEKGAGIGGDDEDDIILLPVKSFKARLTTDRFPDRIFAIITTFDDISNMKMVERRVQALIEERHKIGYNKDPDFDIMNLTEIVNKIKFIGVVLTILLASIASISLFVGSIGIMNMMLTSVTERTREIGVRKAIGATDSNILVQFLMEAIFISTLGGIIGMLLGICLSQLVGYGFEYEVPISVITIVISLTSALFVGIVSGIFPALKATKLNVIDALRYQ